MITVTHTALVLRDARGSILDTIELRTGAIVTVAELRELMRLHRADSIETVTTTERRRA